MEETQNNNGKQQEESERLSALQAELDEIKNQLTEEKNRLLRTRADFDNYRKRIEREDETRRLNIKKEILTDLLTFLDYFDQARKQLKEPSAAKGLEIMARQFDQLLEKQGVRAVECIGLPFDPELQEGVGFVATADCTDGCVAEEICSGYMLGDILLKPARVMVARNPDQNNTEQEK
jgi:molecular chaperone GrpE